MKKWNMPELVELDLKGTEYNWFGCYHDGGYIGDGIVSGHATWKKPQTPSKPETNPENPVSPLS